MERRGEGFERERHVPERGPEGREATERERIAEQRQVTPRPSEPIYDDRYGALEPGIVTRSRDLTRWGPVIGGFFAALSLMVLLGVLGAAIGLQVAGGAPDPNAGIGAAVWGAITLIVSFFAGGWIAGRTAAIAGPLVGLIHGFAVWAVTLTVLLFVGAFGLASALGAVMGGTGGLSNASPAVAQLAGWGTFVALILGLGASLLGGWVGGQNLTAPQRPAR